MRVLTLRLNNSLPIMRKHQKPWYAATCLCLPELCDGHILSTTSQTCGQIKVRKTTVGWHTERFLKSAQILLVNLYWIDSPTESATVYVKIWPLKINDISVVIRFLSLQRGNVIPKHPLLLLRLCTAARKVPSVTCVSCRHRATRLPIE